MIGWLALAVAALNLAVNRTRVAGCAAVRRLARLAAGLLVGCPLAWPVIVQVGAYFAPRPATAETEADWL